MNWGDLGAEIVKIGAPLLGGVMGGAPGAMLGKVIANQFGVDSDNPKEILAAIQADPQAAVKLKQIQANQTVELQRIAAQEAMNLVQAESNQLAEVNKTMREESKSEDPWTRRWRPWNGYLFGPALILIYGILPMMGKDVPDVPPMAWVMWGSVLGVTAWHRGRKQRTEAGEQSQPGVAGVF